VIKARKKLIYYLFMTITKRVKNERYQM